MTTTARADQYRTVTGVITSIRRLKSHPSENVRVAVTIDGQEYTATFNTLIAHGIEYHEYRERVHAFELDGQGNIASVRFTEAHWTSRITNQKGTPSC